MRDEAVSAVNQHETGPFTITDWHALPEREDDSRLELLEEYWLVTPPPTGQHQWGGEQAHRAPQDGYARLGKD